MFKNKFLVYVVICFCFGQASIFAAGICTDSAKLDSIVPKKFKADYSKLDQSQAVQIKLGKRSLLVQNREIATRLLSTHDTETKLPKKDKLLSIARLLAEKNTTEFPVTKEGYLAAANNGNHAGGYGMFMWFRDLARAFKGIVSLPKLKSMFHFNRSKIKEDREEALRMGQAMIDLFIEPEQFARILKNIDNPEFLNDPVNGYRNVPHIRLSIHGRQEGEKLTDEIIEKESQWGHKQNDAFALYAHSLLDALGSNTVHPRQMNTHIKAQLLFLSAFFERVKFYEMEDTGAWEELMGVRSSSIGLVTSFLERMENGLRQAKTNSINEAMFFASLNKEIKGSKIKDFLTDYMSSYKTEFDFTAPELLEKLNQSLANLSKSIDHSYEMLLPALGIHRKAGKTTYGPMMEVTKGNVLRDEDAAILHLLLYPPQRLTLEDKLHILSELKKKLLRPAGIARYKSDWFLYGNAHPIEFSGNFPFPANFFSIKDRNGYRATTFNERAMIYQEFQNQKFVKDMRKVEEYVGENMEAQWSFQDAMFTQIYIQLYKETGDKHHMQEAWFHLARALGTITGENQINIEGHSITPFRAPEAWIPVVLTIKGESFTSYFASENSPLNWTTAEIVTALYDYLEAM